MPELLRVPFEPGAQSFECFNAKAFAGEETINSPGFPIAQATEISIYHKMTNTSADVVDIDMKLQISADGKNWDDAGSPFTNPFNTISQASADETEWNILTNIPTYAALARIQLYVDPTTIGCTLTVNAVVSRKTA